MQTENNNETIQTSSLTGIQTSLVTGLKRKSSEYTPLCRTITKQLTKKFKKQNGIYFTPPTTIDHILTNVLAKHVLKMKAPTVLEPSCGSCQFIEILRRKFAHISHITGVEKCAQIYQKIKHLADAKTSILNQDFFTFQSNTKYDLIVGNPPFFEIKRQYVGGEYLKFINGRPNAYVVFLLKSLKLLNDNGILCFVLLSFDKARRFIDQHFTILGVEKLSEKYLETSQKTFVLTIQKKTAIGKQNDQFTWKAGTDKRLVFGQKADIAKLKELSNESTTFAQMGFTVSLGPRSWKQNMQTTPNILDLSTILQFWSYSGK